MQPHPDPAYDLTLRVRATRLDTAHAPLGLVRGFIQDTLSGWGIPVPAEVEDADAFAALLEQDGEYRYAESDVEVVVKRASRP